MGHRRFLPANYPLRKKGMDFNGVPDHRKKPAHHNGKRVFEMIKDVRVVFGKGLGSEPFPNDDNGRAPMWKKKSILWELPYWEILEVRNAIDVMHLRKNLCVNMLGFIGCYGNSKDTLEARDDLHPEKRDKGQHYY